MAQLPLPGQQFQRFILLFHIVFIAGMCFVLLNRWQRAGYAWGWPEINVTVLVAAQAALYIRFFALPLRSPAVLQWWGFYFPVSFALWFITWRFEPAFEWMVLGYLGQLFGAVPPRYSVPAGLAVFLVWLPAKTGLAGLADLRLRDWLGYLAMVVGWTALGLFIHRLAFTSAERAKLIQELELAKKELEAARERDAELATLRERERLARELHDSLGHGLVTLTVQLEATQKLLPVDPGRASALMEEMKALTRTSMEQLRRSLAGLRAPGLGDHPLGQALQELCAEVAERAHLRIEKHLPDSLSALSPAVCETLWRVAQEGLANVERHARATEARVILERDSKSGLAAESFRRGSQQIALRVVDDGVGLPPNAESRPGHYGLRGLRERVEGLGGTLKVLANTPKGTALEARLPLLPGTP
ncbi:MAG TPA: sensor histidine kinase [Verrucomicrobiae bacterium]